MDGCIGVFEVVKFHTKRHRAENSHVIPALIRRFHEAKLAHAPNVVIWGTGAPRREFLYVDDMAAACVHVMNLEKSIYTACTQPRLSHINLGTGEDLSIRELAHLISDVVGYPGHIEFDASKPDGPPRKLLNVSRLEGLGWRAQIELKQGLAMVYGNYMSTLQQHANG